jgi:hypothetical protein
MIKDFNSWDIDNYIGLVTNDFNNLLSDFIKSEGLRLRVYGINYKLGAIGFAIIHPKTYELFYDDAYMYDLVNFLNYINSTYGPIEGIKFIRGVNSTIIDLDDLDDISSIIFTSVYFEVDFQKKV